TAMSTKVKLQVVSFQKKFQPRKFKTFFFFNVWTLITPGGSWTDPTGHVTINTDDEWSPSPFHYTFESDWNYYRITSRNQQFFEGLPSEDYFTTDDPDELVVPHTAQVVVPPGVVVAGRFRTFQEAGPERPCRLALWGTLSWDFAVQGFPGSLGS